MTVTGRPPVDDDLEAVRSRRRSAPADPRTSAGPGRSVRCAGPRGARPGAHGRRPAGGPAARRARRPRGRRPGAAPGPVRRPCAPRPGSAGPRRAGSPPAGPRAADRAGRCRTGWRRSAASRPAGRAGTGCARDGVVLHPGQLEVLPGEHQPPVPGALPRVRRPGVERPSGVGQPCGPVAVGRHHAEDVVEEQHAAVSPALRMGGPVVRFDHGATSIPVRSEPVTGRLHVPSRRSPANRPPATDATRGLGTSGTARGARRAGGARPESCSGASSGIANRPMTTNPTTRRTPGREGPPGEAPPCRVRRHASRQDDETEGARREEGRAGRPRAPRGRTRRRPCSCRRGTRRPAPPRRR